MALTHVRHGDAVVWHDENGLWVGAQGPAFPDIFDTQIKPPDGASFWRTDFKSWYSWDRITQGWIAVEAGPETFDKGGLSPVLGRKYQLLARGPRAHGYAKGAAHRPYAPVEGQFAEYEVVGEGLALYDILGLQERHGHGQVVQGSLFLYVRRGEVYCYTLYGEGVAGVLYGGLDPVLALLYRVVRKTHGGKGGQTPRYVDLNLHRVGVDSECGRAEDLGEHIVLRKTF